ncbi:MAG: hypothetical protein WDN27_03360 [Candidatus Saccharibacteria bacterium]
MSIISDDEEVRQTLAEHGDTIKSETLATSLNEGKPEAYSTDLKVEGFTVTVALAKA